MIVTLTELGVFQSLSVLAGILIGRGVRGMWMRRTFRVAYIRLLKNLRTENPESHKYILARVHAFEEMAEDLNIELLPEKTVIR